MTMTSMETTRQKAITFRDMHLADAVVVLPNAWDHASAAIMIEAGFPAIATTSAGIALAQGYPDGEIIGRARMLEIVGHMARRCPVPVSADLEAGYGLGPDAVATTVSQAIEVGIVGCNIEDSDPQGQGLPEFDEAVERIRAGRAAADGLGIPFVLNARADPYLRQVGDGEDNFRETVRRSNAYLAAGATCVYVPGPGDAETVGRLVKAIDGPLNILGSMAGRASLTVSRYAGLGVRRISIGGSLMLATTSFARDRLVAIRAAGELDYATGALTNGELNRLIAAHPPMPE
jgi:2-methylisocitrate lyase-like PEP mutase family enzyme